MKKLVVKIIGVKDENYEIAMDSVIQKLWKGSASCYFCIDKYGRWFNMYQISCFDDDADAAKKLVNRKLNEVIDKMLEDNSFMEGIDYEIDLKIVEAGI